MGSSIEYSNEYKTNLTEIQLAMKKVLEFRNKTSYPGIYYRVSNIANYLKIVVYKYVTKIKNIQQIFIESLILTSSSLKPLLFHLLNTPLCQVDVVSLRNTRLNRADKTLALMVVIV